MLASFSWSVESNIQNEIWNDLNGNNKADPGEDQNNDGYINALTSLTSLTLGAVFTNAYAQKIAAEFPGYRKVSKLPTYLFSDSLAPSQVDSFNSSTQTMLSNLQRTVLRQGQLVSNPFIAWTNNVRGASHFCKNMKEAREFKSRA